MELQFFPLNIHEFTIGLIWIDQPGMIRYDHLLVAMPNSCCSTWTALHHSSSCNGFPVTDQSKHLDGLISIVRNGGGNWNLGLDDTSTNQTPQPSKQSQLNSHKSCYPSGKFQDLYLNDTQKYRTTWNPKSPSITVHDLFNYQSWKVGRLGESSQKDVSHLNV